MSRFSFKRLVERTACLWSETWSRIEERGTSRRYTICTANVIFVPYHLWGSTVSGATVKWGLKTGVSPQPLPMSHLCAETGTRPSCPPCHGSWVGPVVKLQEQRGKPILIPIVGTLMWDRRARELPVYGLGQHPRMRKTTFGGILLSVSWDFPLLLGSAQHTP